MSMISDDEDQSNPAPLIGNLKQTTPQIPQRRNHPKQVCQHVQPIPDTPESPPQKDQGPADIFRPYSIPETSSSTLFNNTLNISTVAKGLETLTLYPHPQRKEWVTRCLICGKSSDQIIEETVVDYLNQTAQPGER